MSTHYLPFPICLPKLLLHIFFRETSQELSAESPIVNESGGLTKTQQNDLDISCRMCSILGKGKVMEQFFGFFYFYFSTGHP